MGQRVSLGGRSCSVEAELTCLHLRKIRFQDITTHKYPKATQKTEINLKKAAWYSRK